MQTGVLNGNWLDTQDNFNSIAAAMGSGTTTSGSTGTNCLVNHWGGLCTCWSNGWYWRPTDWEYSRRQSINLKLSEVEKLREAVKRNPEIKDILNKFTDHITVEVDF